MGGEESVPVFAERESETPPHIPRPSYAPPRRNFPMGTAIFAGVVILASIAALIIFSGAKVAVTAAENQSFVSGDFIATVSGGDLPFEVISVDKTASVSVPSEGTENVNQAAQGTIIIMNKQDVPQQLIKNTRFQSPDGLVFRIHDSVTVPAGAGGKPGELSVTAYADAAGEGYNVGPTTFTLPGLSGSATFTQVTARSEVAMAGGFSGPRPTVGTATRTQKQGDLNAALESQIQEALEGAVPEGYVLLAGASVVTYEPQPDGGTAGGNVELSEKATARAVVFPKEALAKAIAFQVVGAYSGQPVTLADSTGLTLAHSGDIPTIGAQEFPFSLSGNATIRWIVEPAKIAAAVAGKTRDAAETALSGFPEVDKATLVLRPFWSRSFPEDPEKITVTVENEAK